MPDVTRILDDLQLETLGELVISKLRLSHDQRELLQALIDNEEITEPVSFEVLGLSFKSGRRTIETDVEGLDLSVEATAEAGLLVGIYPEGTEIKLADFVLPGLHRSQHTEAAVSIGSTVCGIELLGRLGGKIAGEGAVDAVGYSFFASGTREIRFKLFREMPAQGARDLLLETLKSVPAILNPISHLPVPGETRVVEYLGTLRLGAGLSYGWSTRGTKKIGTGLDNLELAADYSVDAKLGVEANFSIEEDLAVIYRRTGDGDWVNVSFMKRHDSDLGLAVNLEVDAQVATHTLDGGQKVGGAGAFVDSLLGRTPIPEIVSELKTYDTPQELQDLKDEFVDRISGEVRNLLERPAQEVAGFIEPISAGARELIEAYQEFDADVRSVFEDVLEAGGALGEVLETAQTVAGLDEFDGLLALLSDEVTAGKYRDVLVFFERALGKDLSQVSQIRDGFAAIRQLAQRLVGLQQGVVDRFESAYNWLKKQLYVEELVKRLEDVQNLDVAALLEERIAWLDNYLSRELGVAVDQLVARIEPIREKLQEITTGYDDAVEKSKAALEKALNQDMGLRASLAWNSISIQRALVSVDVNLAEEAGQDAMKDLLRGDLRSVMLSRLTNAHAIRLQKSYFLDELRKSLSLGVVVNGREKLTVNTAIVRRSLSIVPTETGELWVQELSAISQRQRRNRRSMINVNTMFEIALSELFERRGTDLDSMGRELRSVALKYSYRQELMAASAPGPILVELADALDQIDIPVLEAKARAHLGAELNRIGQDHELGGVAIDIRIALKSEALYPMFVDRDSEAFEQRVIAAWDKTVHTVYAHKPAILGFFEAFKGKNIAFDPTTSIARSMRSRADYYDAVWVVLYRATYLSSLKELREAVFQNLRPEDQLKPRLRERLAENLRTSLKKLARRMRSINSLGREPSALGPDDEVQHDFVMTVFSHLVDDTDRSSSVVLSYRHPITGRPMQLRSDEKPPAE